MSTADHRPSTRPERPGHGLAPHLPLHLALAAVVGAVCTVIWAASSEGYFWPVWVWSAVLVSVAGHAAATRVARISPVTRRAFAGHAATSGLLAAVVVVVWGLTSRSSPWPVWPLLGLAAALAAHAAVRVLAPPASERERALSSRVAELTRTRRGAVDVQAVELRRIERDLHDGAQAQLVALSLQLGRAELALGTHPDAAALTDVAELVGAAHRHADLAIRELRQLARGIAPPILTDRGLVEAVRALARHAGIAVTVHAEVRRRPPPAVELAAYFVSAEAITNAAKHAGTAGHAVAVQVTLQERDDVLTVRVADNGPGGANPTGSGLTGLAQRVAALDGTFAVTDGPHGGTVVQAELGYGS